MAHIRAFKALRPATSDYARLIAALPYDVYDTKAARAEVQHNPLSFLSIDRAETMLPEGTDIYNESVYEAAAAALKKMIADKLFIKENEECYYIYSLCMDGRTQTGLVACTAVDDYLNSTCKKHENTVLRKEDDRIQHVSHLKAHTGPIFLTYRNVKSIDEIISNESAKAPIYDFLSEDGVRHTVWKISDSFTISLLDKEFAEKVPYTYIADGHHRAAAAVKNALNMRTSDKSKNEKEEYDYFLSVLFPDKQLMIMDYNRVINDLNGLSFDKILEMLSDKFDLSIISELTDGVPTRNPEKKGDFHIYLNKVWYKMSLKKDQLPNEQNDVIESLDVSIIQRYVLEELFDISDPRSDRRVDFVGGIKGIKAIKDMVDQTNGMAISMFPTSINEIMAAADQNRLMPPKSTWFEPKLRSGLFIHTF